MGEKIRGSLASFREAPQFSSSQNPNFDVSLQQIWFFLLRTRNQNRIFLLLRTQISIFHSKKYVFLFFSEPKFNFSLQESSQNRISSSQISTFHSKKSDFSSFLLQEFEKPSQNRIYFLSLENPNFDFSLLEIWFFLLRTQSQNRISSSQISSFHSRKSNFFFLAFYSKKSKS